MAHAPVKLILSLAAILLAAPAAANDLVYDEAVETPPSSDAYQPPMSMTVSDDARDAYENPRPLKQETVKKGPPPRFDLENRDRFRSWIHELCKLEPVNGEESRRVRIDGKRRHLLSPSNKQGSLQLLLENYVDDVSFEQSCELRRKTDPAACTHARDLNTRKYSGGLDSLRSLNGAKKSADLQILVKEKRLARQSALKSEFFELRDASLDGKSVESARKILRALKEDSSCRTRSVHSSSAPNLAQK